MAVSTVQNLCCHPPFATYPASHHHRHRHRSSCTVLLPRQQLPLAHSLVAPIPRTPNPACCLLRLTPTPTQVQELEALNRLLQGQVESLQLQVVQQGGHSAGGVGVRSWRAEEMDRLGGEVSDRHRRNRSPPLVTWGGGRRSWADEGGGGRQAVLEESVVRRKWLEMEMEMRVGVRTPVKRTLPACRLPGHDRLRAHTHVSSLHRDRELPETLCSLHSGTQKQKLGREKKEQIIYKTEILRPSTLL